MRLRTRPITAAIATTAVAALGILAPTPALAAASGKVDFSENVDGAKVRFHKKDGSAEHGTALLFGLRLEDGSVLRTYCIDVNTAAVDGAKMIEDDWANYPEPNDFRAQPDRVNWILSHSYPAIEDLATLTGQVPGAESLDREEAIAGTQVAIWHFSNGATLDEDNNPDIIALYKHLTGSANTGLGQPTPTLEIDPAEKTGNASDKVGPFTLKTSADKADVKLSNAPGEVTLVDASGNPLAGQVPNDTQFFVKTPAAAGEATIEASAEAEVLAGRLFRGDGVKTQTFIVADSTKTKVTDTAKASWQAAPATTTPPAPGKGAGKQLPTTGSNVAMVLIGSMLLLAIGGALVLAARRRRATHAA